MAIFMTSLDKTRPPQEGPVSVKFPSPSRGMPSSRSAKRPSWPRGGTGPGVLAARGGADVTQAWGVACAPVAPLRACSSHDPACEGAATVLVRDYAAEGRLGLAAATHRRCVEALVSLGLRPSPP